MTEYLISKETTRKEQIKDANHDQKGTLEPGKTGICKAPSSPSPAQPSNEANSRFDYEPQAPRPALPLSRGATKDPTVYTYLYAESLTALLN